MIKSLLPAVLLLAGAVAHAEDRPVPPMDKFSLGPWEDDIGYRQAVRVGNTLHLSGSVGAGAMPDAIKQAYTTVEKTLAHYGLTFHHVVKETIFTTNLDELKAARAVRREFYGKDFPASSWVQVARLFEPGFVIEVEIEAVFPPSAN
jgi:enamine deaminase RidA (YjgF/YER057c/UK114 family)